MTIDYLSDDWFAAANVALAELPSVTTGASSGITVGVRVLGEGRRPDRVYRLVLGSDRVQMIDDDQPTDVRLTMTYDISAAIAQGQVGAQRAFLDGDIRIGGDTTALLGHQASLAEIDDRLSDLRARTRF